MKALLTAFRTLTIISWPGNEDRDLSKSLPWFPVVGLVLGIILYGIGSAWLHLPVNWTSGGALLLVIAQIFLTRGLHLDGLSDWADSLGAIMDREKRLEIMKDSHMGAFGTLALIIALGAKWIAFEKLMTSGSIILVVLIAVLSRDLMVDLMVTLPYARAGQGMAEMFVKGATNRQRMISLLITLVLSVLFGPVGLALLISSRIMILIFRARLRKSFGGITGDLLGMANEITEILLLFLCAMAGEGISGYISWGWII